MAIQGASPEERRVTPHLVVRDAERAVEFYRDAFGAIELYRSPLPDGVGMHFHIRIGDSLFMVTDEMTGGANDEADQKFPVKLLSPQSLGGTSVVHELCVDDADAWYERAVDAGAIPVLPLGDAFWGDRYGWIADPFGHLWAIASILETLTPDEIEERIMNMHGQHQC
jgi:uncharacterized glyoxalase superfamily protein PhnB